MLYKIAVTHLIWKWSRFYSSVSLYKSPFVWIRIYISERTGISWMPNFSVNSPTNNLQKNWARIQLDELGPSKGEGVSVSVMSDYGKQSWNAVMLLKTNECVLFLKKQQFVLIYKHKCDSWSRSKKVLAGCSSLPSVNILFILNSPVCFYQMSWWTELTETEKKSFLEI